MQKTIRILVTALAISTTSLSQTSLVLALDASPLATLRPRQIMRQEIRSERAKIHAARLKERFTLYANRLNNIATRLQNYIDSKKAANRDVSIAQAKLDSAKQMITQAASDGNKAIDMFNAITIATWSLQHPQVKAAIAQAMTARREFVNARQLLVDTASALR